MSHWIAWAFTDPTACLVLGTVQGIVLGGLFGRSWSTGKLESKLRSAEADLATIKRAVRLTLADEFAHD